MPNLQHHIRICAAQPKGQVKESLFDRRQRQRIFLSSQASRPICGPTPTIQWIRGQRRATRVDLVLLSGDIPPLPPHIPSESAPYTLQSRRLTLNWISRYVQYSIFPFLQTGNVGLCDHYPNLPPPPKQVQILKKMTDFQETLYGHHNRPL